VYYVGSGGDVLGLTPDRGDYKWQIRVKGRVLAPPILKSGRLYISTRRRKAGWAGTGLYVVDVKTGKLRWQTKLNSTRVSKFLYEKNLATVEGDGRVTLFDEKGKTLFTLDLGFVDQPTSLRGVAVGSRAYVFSSHQDGNGYVRLVDLAKQRVLASANALDRRVRSMLPAAKQLFLDGGDGTVYAYRLDKSRRPTRREVPPAEFATELLDRAKTATAPIKGLAPKLAGLGQKALPAIEPALSSPNPYVVEVAAEAIALIGSRRSLRALSSAVRKLMEMMLPPEVKADPLLAVIGALAALKDGRSVKVFQRVMMDQSQSPHRRRAAYVALGAIGTPASLAPIWSFKAARQVRTTAWAPPAYTPSFAYGVEEDIDVTPDSWPDEVRQATTRTIQTKGGQIFSAALSPYLGGFNDVWVGPSELSGYITKPRFTGLTVPEINPRRRIRIHKLTLSPKRAITIGIEQPSQRKKGKWIKAKPITLSWEDLGADTDGDKLPDIIERRLHLCVTHRDCDGDGLSDSEDLNPLASGKLKLTTEHRLFREAFFAYFAFLARRGIVVVDPGKGPSFELLGRRDPILSLRRPTIERFRKRVGLHAVDYVSFGGPYPEGSGSGDALPKVVWNRKKNVATIGMDIFRSGENAVGYNVTLKKVGKNWAVTRLHRAWTTNE
jgi:hypothetical protein